MSKALEDYTPQLHKGMIAPSGKHFIYKVENKEVELPFAMADLILLCDGRHSLYQILTKIHQKQGVVHFKKVVDSLILLFQRDFFENAEHMRPLISELQRMIRPSPSLKERWTELLSDFKKTPTKELFLREVVRERLERNSFFSELSEDALSQVLDQCEVIIFSKGQTVIEENDEAKDIYLLLEGECAAETEGFSGIIKKGSFFGEVALREGFFRMASVRATRNSHVLRIPVEALKSVAVSSTEFESLRRQIIVSQYFGSSPHFESVQEDTIERIQRVGQLEVIDSENVVFEDGENTTGLYFLVRGSVRVEISSEKTVVLNQGELFGEISVMAKLPRTARVVTREPCFLFKVSLEAFWEVILMDLSFAYRIEKLCEYRLSQDMEILHKKSLKAG